MATFLIGLLPTYQSFGVWAPVDGREPWLVGGYMVAVAAVSLLSAYLLPETHRRDILPTAAAEPAPASRPARSRRRPR